MDFSAVVCAHNPDNYQNLVEAVDSLLKQTRQAQEIIVVVDGSQILYERFLSDYQENRLVKAILLKESMGVSEARNTGIRAARGDVIAFMDDDAVANRDWMENLAAVYETSDAIAVGGLILPIWTGGVPDYLPEELYWLIGVTHKGFAGDTITEVRNTFGPNMSFRREVFEKIDLFNRDLGFAKRGTSYIQAEETDLALRMKQAYGKGVKYNRKAVVYHKVPPAKLKIPLLLKRGFYQGYSKALVRKLSDSASSLSVEKTYLKTLVFKYIPQRIKRAYRLSELKKGALLMASIISVGLGFTYGSVQKGSHGENGNIN
jgi:glycosyltransferase involved in cell wall biosynthesis